MSKSKSKYYVVWVGQKPGIYTTWGECQEQIKGYPKATYKSFKSKEAAEEAYKGSATEYISVTKKSGASIKPKINLSDFPIEKKSISVDAACSGNPGDLEYRGVITTTGKEIFRVGPLQEGTNNVGEFLALVHGLAFLKKHNQEDLKIYTDSKTAQAWVRNKKLKTTLKKSALNEPLFKLVERALFWLDNNTYTTEIIKWKTSEWGEIPADFGRK